MRDVFEQVSDGKACDPVEAARRTMRPQLRRRFYTEAAIVRTDGGYRIVLDGKSMHTPAGRAFVVPTAALAQAIADEWNTQGELVDPVRMPLTRLVNSIIDGVANSPLPVAAEIAKYLGSDLLFYRAQGPDALLGRQTRHWDPVLAWARERLGARFMLVQGLTFVDQPESALAAARAEIPTDPWQVGALNSITSLTGSALLALAVWRGAISLEEAWTAAHVDEDWNMEQWGRDEIALERRASRYAECQAAAKVLKLVVSP